METAKHIIIISVLVFLIAGIASSTPIEPNISSTTQASCIVQVTIDTGILPFKFDEINSLIHSSSIIGKAAREVLKAMPEDTVISASCKYPTNTGKIVTYPIELSVKLNENVEPAAEEFLKAIVENLRGSLIDALGKNQVEFRTQFETALRQYNEAESQLKKLSEEAAMVGVTYSDASREDSQAQSALNEQLEKMVKLPDLSPAMTLEEVLQEIAHSVEPPLQIQPNWRDLADNADVLPTTAAEMNPFSSVKLGKTLDVLMQFLSSELAELGYTTDDGVITIATKDSLKSEMITVLYDISGLLINGRTSSSFIRAIKETIEPDSWYDENISNATPVPDVRSGGYAFTPRIQTIKAGQGKIVDMQGGKISVYNTTNIQDKITNYLTYFPKEIPSEPVESIPLNLLIDEKQKTSSQKRLLEIDIARLEARQSAAERQILVLSDKIKSETSLDSLSKKRISLLNQLGELKKTFAEQHPQVVAVQKQLDEIQKQIESSEKDTITAELEQLIKSQTQQLETLKREIEIGRRSSSDLAAAEEKLVQAKIQLARRREEIAKPVGVEQLSTINENISMTILDLAEKKAEFKVIERQLGEIESQIHAVSTTDPKILKFRQARKAFQEAEKRFNELKAIETNLQPPQVIAIGLE